MYIENNLFGNVEKELQKSWGQSLILNSRFITTFINGSTIFFKLRFMEIKKSIELDIEVKLEKGEVVEKKKYEGCIRCLDLQPKVKNLKKKCTTSKSEEKKSALQFLESKPSFSTI